MFADYLIYMFPDSRALKLVKNGINISNPTHLVIINTLYFQGISIFSPKKMSKVRTVSISSSSEDIPSMSFQIFSKLD